MYIMCLRYPNCTYDLYVNVLDCKYPNFRRIMRGLNNHVYFRTFLVIKYNLFLRSTHEDRIFKQTFYSKINLFDPVILRLKIGQLKKTCLYYLNDT